MPHILVLADDASGRPAVVMHQERVAAANLDSDHYRAQLIERVGWAVLDADEHEAGRVA
jgi:hypothetical protein